MVYEWDEKRARRTYWTRILLTAVVIASAIGASAWLAAALGLGF